MISFDTNIAVYLWQADAAEKSRLAHQLIGQLAQDMQCKIALQVVGELQNVLRRKLKQPPWEAAQNARNLLMGFDTFQASEANALEALTLMGAGRLNYWDALLVLAARDAGCTHFLTEDMNDGQVYGTITVLNPFAGHEFSAGLKAILNVQDEGAAN
jgi:predicted nucleic acid-binding protein